MRGKLPVGGAVASRGRIIPAHAGQTPCPKAGVLQWTDHPRACGANFKTWVKQTENHGSSPRMRGKRVRARASATRARIIPAHAGQTHRMQRGFMAGPDHPRACGANVHTAYQLRFPAGSSPRMRGKRLHDRCHRQRGRIIPAHAGQTFTSENGLASLTDHPRACGANATNAELKAGLTGSSPRMRGKQSDFMRKLLSAGPSIIGFAQWLQSSYYCSCLQSSAKTPISRGTTPTSLFLGFQNSITLLLLT